MAMKSEREEFKEIEKILKGDNVSHFTNFHDNNLRMLFLQP